MLYFIYGTHSKMDNPSFSGKEEGLPENKTDVTMKSYKQSGEEFVKDGDVKGNETKIDLTESDEYGHVALTPYAGMGKDDLLRFSQSNFWVRTRLVCVVSTRGTVGCSKSTCQSRNLMLSQDDYTLPSLKLTTVIHWFHLEREALTFSAVVR